MPRRINVDLEYAQKLKEIEVKRQAELSVLEKRFEALLNRAKVWKEKQEAIQAEWDSRKKRLEPIEEKQEEHEQEEQPVTEDEELERFHKDKKIYEMVANQKNTSILVNDEPLPWVQRFIDGMLKYEKRIWTIQGKKLVETFPETLQNSEPVPQPEPPQPPPPPTPEIRVSEFLEGEQVEEKIPPKQQTIVAPSYIPQTTEPLPEFPRILSNTKTKKPVKVASGR